MLAHTRAGTYSCWHILVLAHTRAGTHLCWHLCWEILVLGHTCAGTLVLGHTRAGIYSCWDTLVLCCIELCNCGPYNYDTIAASNYVVMAHIIMAPLLHRTIWLWRHCCIKRLLLPTVQCWQPATRTRNLSQCRPFNAAGDTTAVGLTYCWPNVVLASGSAGLRQC